MAKLILQHYDFSHNEIRNAVIQVLASAPSSPVTGQVYYDSVIGSFRSYTGSVWRSLDATILSGAIPNTALTTNPLARANHTGTQTSSTVSDLATVVQAYRLDQFATPTADVAWGSHKITGVTDPGAAQDAATKNYVDVNLQLASQGIASKPSVRLVSTSNISSITGLLTVDSVVTVAGDRVLLTGQTTTSQNGVYIAAAGAWARAAGDADGNNDLSLGATWFVSQGTAYAASSWRLATPTSGAITPGTTSITITQLASATAYTASLGVKLVGNDIEADLGASGGLTLSGNHIIVDRTLVAFKFAGNIGDGSTTAITVTHNLGTLDVIMSCQDATTRAVVDCDMLAATTNTSTYTFAAAPTTNQFRAIISG